MSPPAPPFLLLHGSADRLVPCAQSERLHRALRQAGASSGLTLYDDADHMWAGPPGTAARALQQMITALSRWLIPAR
jgi:acetyl esterase/lipase